MTTRKKTAAKRRRFIAQRNVESIIRIASGRELGRPVGGQAAATQAAASLAACLAIRARQADIDFLLDMVNVCYGEVTRERSFRVAKLLEHYSIIVLLRSYFSRVVHVRPSGRPENIVAKVLAELPQEYLQECDSRLVSAARALEHDILGQMNELLIRIMAAPDEHWETEIHSFLIGQVGDSLGTLHKLLGEVRVDLSHLAEKVDREWETDIERAQ